MLHISTPELNLWAVTTGDAFRHRILHLCLVDSSGEVYTYSHGKFKHPPLVQSGTERTFVLRAWSTKGKRVPIHVTLIRLGLDRLEFRAMCQGKVLAEEICCCSECAPPYSLMKRNLRLYRWAVEREVELLAGRVEQVRQYEATVTASTAITILDWLAMEAHIADFVCKALKHRVRVLRHRIGYDVFRYKVECR